MKVYHDPTANLIKNPTPTSTANLVVTTNGVPFFSSLQTGTNAMGGNSFLRVTSTPGGTLVSTNYFSWFYSDATTVFKAGDVVTWSAYVRPSVDINLRVGHEGRSGKTGANSGFSITNASTATTLCPANVWTRLSGTGTVNPVARGGGDIIQRIFIGGVAGTVIPPGFTLDSSNFMYTRGATLIDYFDGNSPGCSWTGTPEASPSVKNSDLQWVNQTVYYPRKVYNELYNPRFAGGVTISPFWGAYSSGTATGSYSTSGFSQTITVTNLDAGAEFGIYATAADGVSDLIPLEGKVPAGSWLFTSIGTAVGSKHASTDLRLVIELYAADGVTLVGSSTTNYVSLSLMSRYVTASAEAHYFKYKIFLRSTGAFSGTSSITLSVAGVEWLEFGHEATIVGDGVFTGASGNNVRFGDIAWLGTPDASKSSAQMRFATASNGAVKVRQNLINLVPRPQLLGTGAIATGGASYANGTTVTGTRSVSGGKQTITANQLIGGYRRFGILVDGRGVSFGRTLKAGDKLYFRATVDTTNLAAGTQATLYTEVRGTTGTVYAYPTISANPGATEINGFYTLAQDTIGIVTVYIWVQSPSADFTGTSTAIFSNLQIYFLPPGTTDPGYFDGDSPECSWSGGVNNSLSYKPVWQTSE